MDSFDDIPKGARTGLGDYDPVQDPHSKEHISGLPSDHPTDEQKIGFVEEMIRRAREGRDRLNHLRNGGEKTTPQSPGTSLPGVEGPGTQGRA